MLHKATPSLCQDLLLVQAIWLQAHAAQQLNNCAGDGDNRLQMVTEALLPLWHARARSARLATPLLKTADALFSQAGLHSLSHPCVGEC